MKKTVEEESFAQLLEGSLVRPVRFEAGQKVKGRIVKISAIMVSSLILAEKRRLS